jgi:hypothetical protein
LTTGAPLTNEPRTRTYFAFVTSSPSVSRISASSDRKSPGIRRPSAAARVDVVAARGVGVEAVPIAGNRVDVDDVRIVGVDGVPIDGCVVEVVAVRAVGVEAVPSDVDLADVSAV